MPDSGRSQASHAPNPAIEDPENTSGGLREWLQNSVFLIVLGATIIIAGSATLVWNEGQAVRAVKAVDEAGALVVEIQAGKPDPRFKGKLVYVAGQVSTATGVIDPDIGMTQKGVRLARTVEMLQWTEAESGSGQDRKFTYKTEWRDQPVNSATFNEPTRYTNPRFPVIRSRVYTAQDAAIGDYPLGPAPLVALDAGEPLSVGPMELELAKSATGRAAALIPGGFYFGESPDSPRVGDWRATYRLAPEGPASFIARQGAQGLERFRGETGETILLAAPGLLSSGDLLRRGAGEEPLRLWLTRAGGFLLVFVGFLSALTPAQAVARLAPALGSRVAGATLLTAAAATILAGSLDFAAVWVMQRPMAAAMMLAAGIVPAFLLLLLGTLRRNRQAAA